MARNENLVVHGARVYCERQRADVDVERCFGCGYLRGLNGSRQVEVVCGYHATRSAADVARLTLGAGAFSLR